MSFFVALTCLLLPPLPFTRARSLDELHRVADGKIMYSNYRMDVIDGLLGVDALDSTVQTPVQSRDFEGADEAVVIPDSLVAVQAYIMWEQAGKPQVRW